MTIEGIPDGWELVRFDYANKGESFLNGTGEIILHIYDTPTPRMRLIIRKIEKPKQYRPFANAAEFAPHKKRWLTHPENTVIGEFQVVEFNDNGIWCRGMDDLMPYEHAYEVGLRFDDGTPFGIEVKE